MTHQSIQLLEDEPSVVHYFGVDADTEFKSCLDCAFAQFASGGVYGYRWAVQGTEPGAQFVAPTLTRIERPQDLVLTDFSMVVIDSGSLDGDSWKYIYHPALQSGTFLQEA